MLELLVFVIILGVVFTLIWGIDSILAYKRMWWLYSELQKTKPLFIQWPIQGQLIEAGTGKSLGWLPYLIVITDENITLYPKSRFLDDKWSFAPSTLRWFGRPKKYGLNHDELWLHFEADSRWQTLKVRANRQRITGRLTRALKQVSDEDEVTAYRRRRPYIHYGPIWAQPATQDVHGAWILDEPVQLLLTPVALVMMQYGLLVRTFKLAEIRHIGAVPRIDMPDANGLVRFKMQGEEFAFALIKHEEFARLLALAAKRSLEDPQMVKGKKADEDEELVYEEIADESEEILEAGFYIGDDGEIHLRGA